ncbi:MAG TPA: isoprenylcysteine carboxylmethyltransferase family protein [Caulobacteraceae bacterium]|nr:isoprenylcysteine carboxylmethyltransferase family protein [Caulobacteraceae bacterium]
MIVAFVRSPLVWILAFVAAQRLGELGLASANTRRLLARGGREVGRDHYWMLIVLHASWLVAIALTTPIQRAPIWPLVAIFVLLQAARVWVIATLGSYWTTRIITLDEAPLVRGGPFRFVRHPNYLIVACEIAVLPLAFGNWPVAIVWSLANAAVLSHRIRVEMAALAGRVAEKA